MQKKGQVALFVLLGIVIVGIFVWFLVLPRISSITTGGDINPSSYIRDCLQPDFVQSLETLASQGGSIVPSPSLLFESTSIAYLCYTDEVYQPCLVQQPLLVSHVSEEVSRTLQSRALSCMNSLVERYERQGYRVESQPRGLNVSFTPTTLVVSYLTPLTVSRESTQTFKHITFSYPTHLYELLIVATGILEFESVLGDSEPSYFMQFDPDLKIEKLKKDKDTIYTISNVITQEQFRFATRSLVWPIGYGGAL